MLLAYLLILEVGVFLFLTNSPSVGVLLSILLSLLVSFLMYWVQNSSILVLMGLLVFVGGVFVIMSFVIFSTGKDFDFPWRNSGAVLVIPFAYVLLYDGVSSPPLPPSLTLSGGAYLSPFVFVLVILLVFLYMISYMLDEWKD